MKKRIKKLWIEALRSGQYKQGDGQLRDDDDKFCCLGVLCNLHAQAHPWDARQEHDPTSYLSEDSFPSATVLRWAGLTMNNPSIQYKNEETDLATVNDNGASFKRIARLIEAQL